MRKNENQKFSFVHFPIPHSHFQIPLSDLCLIPKGLADMLGKSKSGLSVNVIGRMGAGLF
jgi:hypothetical protein